jgi:hypothetical protein
VISVISVKHCWVLGVGLCSFAEATAKALGCWMLNVGCWVLGVGCWVLDNISVSSIPSYSEKGTQMTLMTLIKMIKVLDGF